MVSMITRSTAVVERIARFCERTALGALFAMVGLVLLQIAGREFFNLGLPSVEELARWSALCLVYLAVPLLFLEGKHVNVDMFLGKISGTPRKIVDMAIEMLSVLFTFVFLLSGWLFMQRAGNFSTPALGMPNLVFYAPVLFGMALSFVAGLVRLVRVAAAPLHQDQSGGENTP
jgi:TRAP-type transport system small permease protein